MTVVLEGYIRVPPNEIKTLRYKLQAHIEQTLDEESCLAFEVTRDDHDSGVFHVFEKFVDEEAFNAHQARIKVSEWGAVSKNAIRFYCKRREA